MRHFRSEPPGLSRRDQPADSPSATQEKVMARRSSIPSLVVSGLALAAALGVGGVLGYNHFVRAQVDNPEKPPDKPADKTDAFKAILPSLRKELAEKKVPVRLDDMNVTFAADAADAVTIEFRGVWLYEGTA